MPNRVVYYALNMCILGQKFALSGIIMYNYSQLLLYVIFVIRLKTSHEPLISKVESKLKQRYTIFDIIT